MIEESHLLTQIRHKLRQRTPNVAIYIEQTPCERMMRLVDGAFNYGMLSNPLPQHVTKLPLLRFAFPEFAHIEMVNFGLRPVGVREDDLHRCVFHGLGIWLKGRSDSWYSDGFREVAERARNILHEHAAIFRSPQCEPLAPTTVMLMDALSTSSWKDTAMVVFLATPVPVGETVMVGAERSTAKVTEALAELLARSCTRTVAVCVPSLSGPKVYEVPDALVQPAPSMSTEVRVTPDPRSLEVQSRVTIPSPNTASGVGEEIEMLGAAVST
jgi:hypothetical protein